MERTQSATPLEAIRIEVRAGGTSSDVWLRRDIVTIEVETPDGTQTMWEADEVHGIMSGVLMIEYVTKNFIRLWAEFEETELTDHELVESRVEVLSQAIEELASIIGGEE